VITVTSLSCMFGHFLLSLLLQGGELEKDNGCIKSDILWFRAPCDMYL